MSNFKYKIIGFFRFFLGFVIVLFSVETLVKAQSILINGGFETGNLDGWIKQGHIVAITQDKLDPYTLNSLHSVAEGKYAVQIGDAIPWGAQRNTQNSSILQQTIVPALSNGQQKAVLQFSYAVVANDPPSHPEIEKPLFAIKITDLTTSESVYNTDYVYTSQTSNKWFLGVDAEGVTRSRIGADRWVFKPWENIEIDLTSRVGHLIEFEFLVRDCNYGAHAAYGYLDDVHVGTPKKVTMPRTEGNPVPAQYPSPSIFDILWGYFDQFQLPLELLYCLLVPILIGVMYKFLKSKPAPGGISSGPVKKRVRTSESEGGGGGIAG